MNKKSVVWKYELPIKEGFFTIEMPEWPQVLHVQIQDGKPHLWAEVNPEAEKKPQRFRWVITGEEFDAQELLWLGTLWLGTLHFPEDGLFFSNIVAHLYVELTSSKGK